MIKNKKLLLSLSLIALVLVSYTYIFQNEKEEAIDQFVMQSLSTSHYAPKVIDDAFSEKFLKVYIQRLDFNKKFLIQSDVDELKKYEHAIDEDINSGHFVFFNKSMDIIKIRVDESQNYCQEILEVPFDFNAEESVELDSDKLNFTKDKDELKEEWRKYLKYQTLSRISEMMDSQEKAKEKSDTVKIKSRGELEIAARKKILKSNNDWFKRLKKLDRNDRLTTYFNSITAIFDPHTEFFPPKEKANFDIGMSGQLEGIGAQLQEKDGIIKVTNIVPGSASYREGQLKAGDVLIKVAQGEAEPVDITDMRLDDAVQLIRGKKGTEVRLTVKKPDNSVLVIPIIRDIVVIEETYAQSVILKGKKNIGYIKLPSFYADFNGKNGRSCSIDVKKELEKLKNEKIDGIILDLRYNGGGSLSDVVTMAGLFIKSGPIVQVKSRFGLPHIMEDTDPSITYDGPLTIMVNSNSASASEILAAAIQDYKRGIIIGTSPSTFGKGTVQRFFNLDEQLTAQEDSFKPLGQVKITTQKFYRINGGATQLKGVIPDIVLPDPYYLLDQGEKEQDYPMKWDEIPPAIYEKLEPSYSISKLKSNSESRLRKNTGFKILENAALRFKKQKDSTLVSLNIDKYILEQKRNKAESQKMEEFDKGVSDIEIISLKRDAITIALDTSKASKTKEWHKSIKKDIYLNETIAIMNELKK